MLMNGSINMGLNSFKYHFAIKKKKHNGWGGGGECIFQPDRKKQKNQTLLTD